MCIFRGIHAEKFRKASSKELGGRLLERYCQLMLKINSSIYRQPAKKTKLTAKPTDFLKLYVVNASVL